MKNFETLLENTINLHSIIMAPCYEGWGILLMGEEGVRAAEKTVSSVLRNREVTKYILAAADKIFKETQKEYKAKGGKVTIDDGKALSFPKDESGMSFTNKYLKTRGSWERIGKYAFFIYADTDHIERVMLSLMVEQDGKSKRVFKPIPSPTKQNLKDLGLRQEYKD